MNPFAERLVSWQRSHGRHDLPWQVTDPYRVWLSEIMLQQTQVATVIRYYQRFTESFPTVADLAAAPLDDVLAHWAGLGYYTRARNLHKAARMVMQSFGGVFPGTAVELMRLPGIGRSTAAAIAGFCYSERTPILDGNVKRVLTRWAGIEGFPGDKQVEAGLWQLAERLLPAQPADMPAFTQGMMDLGATLCTRSKPQCSACPLKADCRAWLEDRTSALPTRKPKKATPERAVYMLLLRHRGQWLLERRPATGIWGGLFSLPEAASLDAAARLAVQRFGATTTQHATLPDLVHTFTHFRLTITPLLFTVHEVQTHVRGADFGWYALDEALQLGIPTPVRTLLQQAEVAAKAASLA